MSSVDAMMINDLIPLAKVQTNARVGDTDNLREVARQFESLFMHTLLKNMRAASLGDGAMDSDQSKFYQDMFDQQMSTELSNGQGLGIADMLIKQLSGGQSVEPVSTFPISRPAAPHSEQLTPSAVAATATNEKADKGPLEFVQQALPHARRVGQALGVDPRFILAQAALESGWGDKPIRNEDGSDSHNVFGIKSTSSWSGSSAFVNTMEFASGIGRRVNAAFRAYSSLAESFDDYAQLLQNSSRYKDALNVGEDVAAFAQALKRGGYATDPDYANKIIGIANGETLKNAINVTNRLHSP